MLEVEKFAATSGLEHNLYELIKTRASQINGCAYCLDMHTKDARKAGETEQRLYMISAWRETDLFSHRESAALAFAEALTKLPNNEVPDDVYNAAAAQFSEEELIDLTIAVIGINSYNRINIAFRTPAGDYVPGQHAVHVN